MRPHIQTKKNSWLLLLLFIPLVVLLVPPFYNFTQPEFIGIPFFYWFQMLWVVVTAILIATLYWIRG